VGQEGGGLCTCVYEREAGASGGRVTWACCLRDVCMLYVQERVREGGGGQCERGLMERVRWLCGVCSDDSSIHSSLSP
jgi:hypothetical protein